MLKRLIIHKPIHAYRNTSINKSIHLENFMYMIHDHVNLMIFNSDTKETKKEFDAHI